MIFPKPIRRKRGFLKSPVLEIRGTLAKTYRDVFTPEAVEALAGLDADRKAGDDCLDSSAVQRGHATSRELPSKPHSPIDESIHNVGYALSSGADGWMFDGEDALGQIETMSLDNQRNLKTALYRDPVFMKVNRQQPSPAAAVGRIAGDRGDSVSVTQFFKALPTLRSRGFR
jgi:hypothetical protein